MTQEKLALRFARQDEETLALLARVQWETGYVPTMDELGQLLQCPTTRAARKYLDTLLASGTGTRATAEERQQMIAVAGQYLSKNTIRERGSNASGYRGHIRDFPDEQEDGIHLGKSNMAILRSPSCTMTGVNTESIASS